MLFIFRNSLTYSIINNIIMLARPNITQERANLILYPKTNQRKRLPTKWYMYYCYYVREYFKV